jgi:ketosteroid isomerase-like protein
MQRITLSKTVAFIACLILSYHTYAQKQKNFAEKEIFDLEASFSKDSKELGFLTANLKYASDEAIVFRPKMINAKEWSYKLKGTDSNYQITWYPSHIEVSAAGDLGYATGPFDNVSKVPGDTSENHGQFLTVWKRQDDGTLKFIIDFGSNQLPRSEFVKKEPAFQALTLKHKYIVVNEKKSLQELFVAEKNFNEIDAQEGDVAAYKKYANNDIRFFYQRQFYIKGLDNVISRIKDIKGFHNWKPINAFVAESGDLAYVYGTHEFKEIDTIRTGYYLRIWEKNGSTWTIVAQVRSLLPKE